MLLLTNLIQVLLNFWKKGSSETSIGLHSGCVSNGSGMPNSQHNIMVDWLASSSHSNVSTEIQIIKFYKKEDITYFYGLWIDKKTNIYKHRF